MTDLDLLLVYAAAVEGDGLDLPVPTLCTGVGKAPAAARLARALALRPARAVLVFGVCGAYPMGHQPEGQIALGIRDLCVVATDRFVDEGVEMSRGFRDLASLGLDTEDSFRADPGLSTAMAERLGVPVVSAATVSTCSGTDTRSREYAARSGAAIETMEGAAIALVCRDAGVPWGSVRAVSNFTGDRSAAGFDLTGAAAQARSAVVGLLDAGVI